MFPPPLCPIAIFHLLEKKTINPQTMKKTELKLLSTLSGRSKKWLEDASTEEIKNAIMSIKEYADQTKEANQIERTLRDKDEKIKVLNSELHKRSQGDTYALITMLSGGLFLGITGFFLPISLPELLSDHLPIDFVNGLLLFLLGAWVFNFSNSSYIAARMAFTHPEKHYQEEKDEVLEALHKLYEPATPNTLGAHAIKFSKVIDDLREFYNLEVNPNELGRRIKADSAWHRKQVGSLGKFLYVKFKKTNP